MGTEKTAGSRWAARRGRAAYRLPQQAVELDRQGNAELLGGVPL